MSTDHTCPRVSNLLLLDSEGKRIAVKYFDENKCALTCAPPFCLRLQCAPRPVLTPPSCSGLICSVHGRSSVTAQGNYEKSVFAKTSRTNARGEGAARDLLLSGCMTC